MFVNQLELSPPAGWQDATVNMVETSNDRRLVLATFVMQRDGVGRRTATGVWRVEGGYRSGWWPA